MNKVKLRGSVYTPQFIVNNMLDLGGYSGPSILGKHIIDNSCGDGAFLQEIVRRYCTEFLERNDDKSKLCTDLATFIHGIEIDGAEHQRCIDNLQQVVADFGITTPIKWNVLNTDTLTVDEYNGVMDYVFGNPPYVRVHNLKENHASTRSYTFCQKGMTDLYIVFFEIGFSMLNKTGKMCLITPSSWLSSKAGMVLREYIKINQTLTALVDLEHFQAFNATTYSLISLFTNQTQQSRFEYYTLDKATLENLHITSLTLDQISINSEFYLGEPSKLKVLKEVLYSEQVSKKYVNVKNGFATLCDNIFIGEKKFSHCINILKASTGKWTKCIFPYDCAGNALGWDVIEKDPQLSAYLLEHKEQLVNRSLDASTSWYLFGRSQAIKDVSKQKIAINSLLKDITSVKVSIVEAGEGIYSGLYILTDQPFDRIISLLRSNDFVDYIKMLKKYKSGGYYTFNSKDVERYLNYHLSKSKNAKTYDQPRYSQSSISFV